MGGWASDDDADPRAQLEAANGERQARRLLELIARVVQVPATFELNPGTICELNGIAMTDLTPNPGRWRDREVEILGSRHEPPVSSTLPILIDEMCAYVNQGGRDAVETAAYVLWRLNWIHPFEEGNGRTARAVAYLVLCAALGQALPGEVTLVERLVWYKIRYYRALEDADEAWKQGRLDVTTMTTLLRELLEAQLLDRSPNDAVAIETVSLYRPVGRNELDLIEQAAFRAFPPRLPDQPIFYPVLDEEYAVQIARDWNTVHSTHGLGYVTRFRVNKAFLAKYPIQTVGSSRHREYWIPAEELPAFNANIVGVIEVVAEFSRQQDP